MKKLLLPFLALLFLISCGKESSNKLISEVDIYENDSATARGSNKVNICHNGHIIQVNSNALDAHLNHGDEVEFGQLGNYNITYRIGNSENIHEGEIIQSGDGSFTGSGQNLTTGQEWTLTGDIDSEGNYSFTLDYINSSYTATATGTFECDGSGYFGDWMDSSNQTGTWTGVYLSY